MASVTSPRKALLLALIAIAAGVLALISAALGSNASSNINRSSGWPAVTHDAASPATAIAPLAIPATIPALANTANDQLSDRQRRRRVSNSDDRETSSDAALRVSASLPISSGTNPAADVSLANAITSASRDAHRQRAPPAI